MRTHYLAAKSDNGLKPQHATLDQRVHLPHPKHSTEVRSDGGIDIHQGI